MIIREQQLNSNNSNSGPGNQPFFAPQIQRQEEQGAEGNQQVITNAAGEVSPTGICFQTPFGGGEVMFSGFSATELNDFSIIPEAECSTPFTPMANTWHDADGFWWSGEPHRERWFKVSNHCEAEVKKAGAGFQIEACCNGLMTLFKGVPRWTNDTLWSDALNARCYNPFAPPTVTP